ncbi:CBU_0585 family protein [Pleionea mediterranea]|uniref:Uncharacterized protein n=1 Tax=Pleionea mediterranea TaxID=523701 RepID=A0A316FP12_9GAMM|nr:CBU_0585 family protein [Pleionea mediterranea]PWK49935.1 hypothetical protein C8D97_10797 [Pleionea mediterranea]
MSIDRNYVSEMDKFLIEFDKKPESHSESRAFEEEKYKRVHKLRDEEQAERKPGKLWESF